MDDTNIEDKLKNLNINQKTDINILLLGGTGVGKSTMINSIANYLTYGDLKKAKKDKLMVLIPTQFHVKDKNGKTHTISTGENDQNEFLQVGESATQDVKTYVFPIWNGQVKIRLIDTPGMGDTRGITQDDVNSENILSYIGNLHELHAICFLLKPNESRDTVFFKYCMNQIFSRLDKSACTNIIFCFTNTRGSDYTPGETVGILTKNIEEIRSRPPYAEIPLNRNIFCFDNEPFKYLAAVKKDVEFDSDIKERNKESWKKSAEQCWSLINYIVGDKKNKPLKPHFVKSTNAINEARRMINQLAQPLAEITQLIHQNMNVLERHKDILQVENMSIEEMKKKLYMPVLALEITQLTQPVTVCAARKCAEVLKTAGENVWHYKQRCHDPCFLTNVPKEVIGSPELTHCAAMGGTTTCTKCHCDFKVHMHVYYLSKVIEKQEKDSNMQKKITTREQLVDEKRKIMRNIEYKQQELDEEHRIVVETCAKFAHFLQNNAITPFNDAYKEYIEYLINREKSLGNLCDKETVKHLQGLLLQYVQIKNRFDEALKSTRLIGRDDIITSKEIYDSIQTLYKLKHNGKKIKELYECQKKSRTKEFQNTEYVHNVIKLKQSTPLTDEDKKKPKNKDNKDKKNKDAKNDRQQRGSTASDDAGRPRGRSPPPTYQEARRNERLPQHRNPNYNSNGYPDQGPYRPNMGPAPNMGPVPPLMGPNVFPPPGPHWQQGGPSRGNNNQYEFAVNRGGAPAGSEYDVNIVFKKRNEPKGEYPPYNFQPYNDPIYPHQNPNYPPQHPNYPPQNPNYPPQHFGYPSNYPPYGQYYGDHQRYDYHHGVNRQNSGANNYQGPSARGGYQGPRGNEQGRGGENRGQKGRGGINKRTRGKKPKGNEKENSKSKKEDKPKKGKKSSSDSDDSDSSSD